MIRIRGGSGLGDSLYVQAIARHLIGRGEFVEACSDWVDVFRPLGGKCVVSPFRRDRIDMLAHYSIRLQRGYKDTDQFVDCCLQAGIREPIDLRLEWSSISALIDIRAGSMGLPTILVQLPRAPMNRTDGYGAEMLPDCRVIQRAIDLLRGRAFIVQVGKGEPLYHFSGIDRDLANVTSISGLIDTVYAADGCLGYCSFMVPLAESLSKPALIVWSRRGLNSRNGNIAARTPKKVIHDSARVKYVIDDCSENELSKAVDALLEQIGNPGAV